MQEGEKRQRRRMKFLPEEDASLKQLVALYGDTSWVQIASRMPGRNIRQCRERWKHYLSCNRAKSPWTEEEDRLLFEKYCEFGPKWTKISRFFNERSDIQIKSRWQKKFIHFKNLNSRQHNIQIPYQMPSNIYQPIQTKPLYSNLQKNQQSIFINSQQQTDNYLQQQNNQNTYFNKFPNHEQILSNHTNLDLHFDEIL